ncbi:hypothetical protein CYY_007484 [Polysphondylium violaceum]|uniref:Endo-beta-1,2-glucanase SGL domain-containing protein n=1 Tax=Polysphondylium violaceum TaxID=133409 RepID=A0A8J4PPP1_9MYCE|nr:hypothetical protein CYY_007484 [Polysphondylium violaceum]
MVNRYLFIGVVLLLLTSTLLADANSESGSSNSNACRFAPLYSMNDILENEESINSFIENVLYWEGNFQTDGVGINIATGYTYDGHALDYSTGEIASYGLHNFSAPSKESIHLGMLARALISTNGINVPNALDFFHVKVNQTQQEKETIYKSGNQNLDNVITILYRKIKTYEDFLQNYPGYGGFMPWVSVDDNGISPIPGYWTGRVPGLDNGEMIWGIYSVYNILISNSTYSTNYPDLGQRYKSYFDTLASNAIMMFYNSNGYISSVTSIKDIFAQPTADNYQNDGGYLDDPYEGELLTVFMDLFCQWPSRQALDQVWINKRTLLQSTVFSTPKGDITVQKGWWFSSHEQWKYLMLPYQSIDINRRIFLNGERARTWFSFINEYPGLFASVTNVSLPNDNPNYVSATGIQSISFETILTNDLMTPYGSFPLFLTGEPSLGLSWYYNMLIAPAMQNPYGSTESFNPQGTEISPVITWDSKITTVLSIVGGLADVNGIFLAIDGKLDRFQYIINREWSLAFPNIQGEDLPFMYPQVQTPMKLNDFSMCN